MRRKFVVLGGQLFLFGLAVGLGAEESSCSSGASGVWADGKLTCSTASVLVDVGVALVVIGLALAVVGIASREPR